jgi:hypothetical protein
VSRFDLFVAFLLPGGGVANLRAVQNGGAAFLEQSHFKIMRQVVLGAGSRAGMPNLQNAQARFDQSHKEKL